MNVQQCFKSVLAMGILLAACGDDGTGLTDEPCLEGTTAVEAAIGVGSSVTFDWSPACGVALLLVEPVGSGSDQWGLMTPEDTWDTPGEGNAIRPPVTYGVVPSGTATATMEPETLVAGQSYELILWRIVPFAPGEACIQRLEEACLIEVKTFTR